MIDVHSKYKLSLTNKFKSTWIIFVYLWSTLFNVPTPLLPRPNLASLHLFPQPTKNKKVQGQWKHLGILSEIHFSDITAHTGKEV